MIDKSMTHTGGGHIIRTLVFGLISNAFDVGSDLLNAFQYYRYFFALVCVAYDLVWFVLTFVWAGLVVTVNNLFKRQYIFHKF